MTPRARILLPGVFAAPCGLAAGALTLALWSPLAAALVAWFVTVALLAVLALSLTTGRKPR